MADSLNGDLSPRLRQLREDIAGHLEAIKRNFKDRDGTKLTLVIRQVAIPGDSSIVLTDDADTTAIIAEIEKLRAP